MFIRKALLAVSIVIVCALAAAGIYSLNTLNSGTDIAASTQGARYQLSRVLQLLVEMGGGTRRFEGSADPAVFNDARAAAEQLPAAMKQLRELLADDRDQTTGLRRLQELSDQRRQQTEALRDLAITQGVEAMKATLARGEGTQIIEQCRDIVTAMQARLTHRWDMQRQHLRGARLTLLAIILASAGITAVLILLNVYTSDRDAKRLRRAQDDLITTLRSIGDAVISTDAQGNVRFMNGVAEALTGWSASKANGRSLAEVFKIVQEVTRAVVEDPVSRVIREKTIVGLANHTLLIDRLGVERPIEDSGAPIYGRDGSIVGVVLVFRDATTQRDAAHAVQEAQDALRKVNATLESQVAERSAKLAESVVLTKLFFEHSGECHAILSQVGDTFQYDEVNPELLRLYGKSKEAVIGHTLEEVLGPDTAETLKAQMLASLSAGVPFRYERKHAHGAIEAIATPVPTSQEGRRRLVVSARDVTQRRQLEQQLQQSQKMEAVGQLTGGLAHDFNNLLTAISGSLELIEKRISRGNYDQLERFIDAAKGGAQRAAALTHRLLAFSRRQTLDPRPIDVLRLISDMAELIRRTVGPAVQVTVTCEEGLWQPKADGNQLENALLNLCINARDAMPDGGQITIEAVNLSWDPKAARERGLAPGDYISLCVRDNGCGMPPEVAARAFEPFFTTKPLGEGTGLGLSMIYGFVQQSGGEVKISSVLGQGSSVYLYLPRYQGSADTVIPIQTIASPSLRATHKVLVVDDEASVRMLVAEVLSDLGCDAIECTDGVSALKVLESSQEIDLMVTDVGLPNGINGRQLADFARVLRPALKVMFITGYAENAVYSHGQSNVGYEVLSKPFSLDILASRISAMLEKG